MFLHVRTNKLNLKKTSGSRIEDWGYSSALEHTVLVCARPLVLSLAQSGAHQTN